MNISRRLQIRRVACRTLRVVALLALSSPSMVRGQAIDPPPSHDDRTFDVAAPWLTGHSHRHSFELDPDAPKVFGPARRKYLRCSGCGAKMMLEGLSTEELRRARSEKAKGRVAPKSQSPDGSAAPETGATLSSTYIYGSYFYYRCRYRTQDDWYAHACTALSYGGTALSSDYGVGIDATFNGAFNNVRELWDWRTTLAAPTNGGWFSLEWATSNYINYWYWHIFDFDNGQPIDIPTQAVHAIMMNKVPCVSSAWFSIQLYYEAWNWVPGVGSTTVLTPSTLVEDNPFFLSNTGICGAPPTPTAPPAATATATAQTATPTATARPTATPVSSPSSAPAPIAPGGCVSGNPTFLWLPVTGATQYQIAAAPAAGSLPQGIIVPGTSYTPALGVLTPLQKVGWSVRAGNGAGWGPWDNQIRFMPGCDVLAVPPALVAPYNGASLANLTPTLSWQPVAGASGYRLWISDDTTPGGPSGATVTDPSYPVPVGTLHAGHRYHWRVEANADPEFNQGGPSSATWFFSIDIPLPIDPAMRTPDIGSGPDGGPDSVGCPVSVSTGNMYLDQTDIVVPGAGPPLAFTRHYNSQNIAAGKYGILGPGWTHSFEASLQQQTGGSWILQRGDGTALYFLDQDGDGIAEPLTPVSEQSSISVQSDGTRVRSFRAGGAEYYDSNGRLSSIRDAAGLVLTVNHNPDGTVSTVKNASGRVLTFTYASGQLTGLSGPGGLVTATFTYTTGQLQTVSYRDGSGYSFDYVSQRLTAVKDNTSPAHVLESHTYYPDGRAQTSSKADGIDTYTLTYGSNQTVVTDSLGNTITYDFAEVDRTKRVTRITGSCGCAGSGAEVQEWSYNSGGRVSSYRDAQGHITSYEYDPVTGDLAVTRDALLNPTVFTYYPDGRVKRITTPENGFKFFTYGPTGPTSVTESIDDTHSRTTSIQYNATSGLPEVLTDARGKVTRLTYDPATYDLLTSTSPPSTDPVQLPTKFTYDAMGRLSTVTDPLNRKTITAYDAAGRVQRVTYPDQTFTETTYDLGGRRTSVKDALGQVTWFTYDAYGRPVETMDALKNVTRQTYDAMSHRTSITDAEGHVTRFDYDGLGRLSRTVYPDYAAEPLTYDSAGRVSSKIDRKGVKTSYAYNGLGQLVKKSYSDGSSAVTYTYDNMGRMLTAANDVDTLTWTYDHLGRVRTETSSLNGPTLTYDYDNAGNRLSLSANGNVVFGYDYYDNSALKRIRYNGLNFDFNYDNGSQRSTLTYPNGVVNTYQINNMSRLTSVSAAKSGTVVSSAGYTYDNLGNRLSKTLPEVSETYGYDAISRLTRVSRTAQGQASAFGYDRVGNRVTDTTNGAAQQSTYDVDNALRTRSVGGTEPIEGTVSEPANVKVDGQAAQVLAGNRFAAKKAVAAGANNVTVAATDGSGNTTTKSYSFQVSGQPATFDYDANGNLISKVEGANTWTYEWTVENQLKRVLKNGAEVARFTYDPLGRRVQKIAGGVTRTYLYDGQDIARETLTGSSTAAYLYVHGPGIDEPLAKDAAGTMTYYHADGLGSIVKVTNAAGAVIDSKQYDAWGNIEVGSATGGYAFTGREWDPETGLYYYRARYYDPKVGRFITEDPMGRVDDSDAYRYVHDNSVSHLDPSGMVDIGRATDWVLQHAPQYVSINLNVGTWIGWSGQLTFDGRGNIYWAPIGVTLGKSATVVSGSITFGWIRGCPQGHGPSSAREIDMLSGHGFNGALGYILGIGFSGNDSGTAWEFGLFSPQAGVAWHYSFAQLDPSASTDTAEEKVCGCRLHGIP